MLVVARAGDRRTVQMLAQRPRAHGAPGAVQRARRSRARGAGSRAGCRLLDRGLYGLDLCECGDEQEDEAEQQPDVIERCHLDEPPDDLALGSELL